MHCVSAGSRAVASAGDDDASTTMEPELPGGRAHRPVVVPRSAPEPPLAADSIGRFFQQRARGTQPHQRVS